MAVYANYRHRFPVDEFGRPGGLFSLADLPIDRYEILERRCEVLSKDSAQQLYKVKDLDLHFEFVVPYANVDFDEDEE